MVRNDYAGFGFVDFIFNIPQYWSYSSNTVIRWAFGESKTAHEPRIENENQVYLSYCCWPGGGNLERLRCGRNQQSLYPPGRRCGASSRNQQKHSDKREDATVRYADHIYSRRGHDWERVKRHVPAAKSLRRTTSRQGEIKLVDRPLRSRSRRPATETLPSGRVINVDPSEKIYTGTPAKYR